MANRHHTQGLAQVETQLPLHADATKAQCASFFAPLFLGAFGFIGAIALLEVLA